MRILCAALALVATLSVCAKLDAQVVRERPAERLQDLNLTDDQETRIADIRKEYRPKIQEASQELAAIVRDEVEKIRAAFTPAQKEKLQALREERQERRAEGLAQQLAHVEELDLTDGEMTQIEDIRKEYRPKIEKAMEGMRGILTDDQRKARETALRAGKTRREVLESLNLTGAQKEKVEAVCKEVGSLVREEMEKIRDVLTAEQQAKLAELRDERREHIRDRWAARVANVRDLNLTDAQKTALANIRQEFRSKVHEAGNKLRAAVRDEVGMIVAVIKG
jgi:Spy/CpxP family protein refolding chaperone